MSHPHCRHQYQPGYTTTGDNALRDFPAMKHKYSRRLEELLGMTAFQRYVETPIQTLDGVIVTQPKRFLPLAQEARKIAEEICIEKINEQWAGLPREQLLNQSFNDQLNSIQILEQLAPLQLAKDHYLEIL